MAPDTSPVTVSVKAASAMTGLSPWQIKQRCKAGLISSRFDGEQRLIDHQSLLAYIEGLPTERPEQAS